MSVLEFLWLYQTLIAGVLAVVAAVGTALLLAFQIREQRVQFNERKKLDSKREIEKVHERTFVSAQIAFYKLSGIANLCNKYIAQLETLGHKGGSFYPFPRDLFFDRDEMYAIFLCGGTCSWDARSMMISMDTFNESLSFPGKDDRTTTLQDLLNEILECTTALMEPLALLPAPLHASVLKNAVEKRIKAAREAVGDA